MPSESDRQAQVLLRRLEETIRLWNDPPFVVLKAVTNLLLWLLIWHRLSNENPVVDAAIVRDMHRFAAKMTLLASAADGKTMSQMAIDTADDITKN